MANAALKLYQNTGLVGGVAAASPHRLIEMMLDGALERVRLARTLLEHKDIPRKAAAIGAAMGIVDGLRMSLNAKEGGVIAENLELLYAYVNRRLLQANAENNVAILSEVESLLADIRSAWLAVAPVARSGAPRNAAA